jgi:NAD(P)-dependent dehydrogenase (short-subunit alcohol dehydrogenase family)
MTVMATNDLNDDSMARKLAHPQHRKDAQMTLANRHAVVIGGSSGMGLETVRMLAEAGARVTATGRDDAKLQAAIAGLGPGVRGVAFDARERPALDRFFAETGPVDHLVLSLSGGAGAGPFAQLDLQSLRRGFEEKFWPQVEAAQAGLARLVPGGSVTFISAISARIANPGTAGLAAINAAIEAMVGTLARELAPSRVNAVSPGVVDTPWWDRMPPDMKQAVFAQQRENLPVRRVGQPRDVAHAVRFLVENGFMTGAVIECDGGMRLL